MKLDKETLLLITMQWIDIPPPAMEARGDIPRPAMEVGVDILLLAMEVEEDILQRYMEVGEDNFLRYMEVGILRVEEDTLLRVMEVEGGAPQPALKQILPLDLEDLGMKYQSKLE
jgi:hypothetical protein